MNAFAAVLEGQEEVLAEQRPVFGEHRKYSPDLFHLEQFEFIPFFICDEMMREFEGYEAFKEASFFYATAFTLDRFLMLRKNLGKASSSIPLDPAEARLLVSRAEVLPIRGEIHMIRPYAIAELDTRMLNGVEFKRKRVPLQIPHQLKIETEDGGIFYSETQYHIFEDIEFMMYVGNYDHWQWSLNEKVFELAKPVEAKHPYYFHAQEGKVPGFLPKEATELPDTEQLKAMLSAKHPNYKPKTPRKKILGVL